MSPQIKSDPLKLYLLSNDFSLSNAKIISTVYNVSNICRAGLHLYGNGLTVNDVTHDQRGSYKDWKNDQIDISFQQLLV